MRRNSIRKSKKLSSLKQNGGESTTRSYPLKIVQADMTKVNVGFQCTFMYVVVFKYYYMYLIRPKQKINP